MIYLIIGDAASMHIYNFIKIVLIDEKYDIYVLRHSTRTIPDEFEKFYRENHITVLSPDNRCEKTDLISKIKRFVEKVNLLRKIGKIDVCDIQYLHKSSCLLYLMNRRKIKKLMLTFWGSDLLASSKIEQKLQQKCLPYADIITVGAQYTREKFKSKYGNIYNAKLHTIVYPSPTMDIYKNLAKTLTKKQCREKYHIEDGKICVTCGYSADSAQHQDECLREIKNMPQSLKDKIHVIIPMQYGKIDEVYRQNVKEAAVSCGCSFNILTEFALFEENAKICFVTDIYIHVRDTDVFSMSMREQLYTGSYMIQGKWLKYKEFDNLNLKVLKINSIDQLGQALETLMKNYHYQENIQLEDSLYELSNVSKARNEWNCLIKRLFAKS